MPKYFNYKSIDDLRKDIEKHGLDLRLETELKYLKQPVQIGTKIAGNSLAIHPMEGCDGSLDGKPDELVYRRWERFGAGGVKLIWGEATAVLEEARANTRQLLVNEENAKDLEKLLVRTRMVHKERFGSDDDLIIGMQLTHSGRYSCRKPLIVNRDPILDKITYLDKKKGVLIPDDYPLLSDDELEKIEDAFVSAAKIAYKIGFDFVDIKQCHRYLLSELLASFTREGKYGGSFENRTRFVRNVIGKIKSELGDGLILASRFNAYDGAPYRHDTESHKGMPHDYKTPYLWGFGVDQQEPLKEDLTEPKALVKLLMDLGVKLVNVSMGNPYANPHVGRPFEKPPIDGYETPEHPLLGVDRHFRITAQIQQEFPDLPIVGTGYSWLQEYLLYAAEANKRDGKVTIAGVGRGALAYPDYAHDGLELGKMDRKKVCVTVSYCTALMRAKGNELGQFATGCVPRDPEVYLPLYKKTLKKE